MIDVSEYLPFKLKNLNFNRLIYSTFKEKGKQKPSLLLYDDTGFVLDIDLQQIFYRLFVNNQKEEFTIKSFAKESYDILADSIIVETISLSKDKKVALKQSEYILQRVHDKQVSLIAKVRLELSVVLTISKDGFIKLWNQSY